VTGDAAGPPSETPHWVAVAASADLLPGTALCVETAAGEVALFNVEGEVLALEARCLHRGGVLTDGLVADGIVTCPLHWWRYDLHTGERLGAPDLRLTRYPVRQIDGRIEVLVVPHSPPPAPSLRARLLSAAQSWSPPKAAPPPG